MASIGSFISSTAFLTEFASVTSPIIISKIVFPVFSSRSFLCCLLLSHDFCKKELPFLFLLFQCELSGSLFPKPRICSGYQGYFRSCFLLLRLLVTCWMEQPDRQLMMAAQRSLSRLDARRSEHGFLPGTMPALSSRKSTRPTPLDKASASMIECPTGVSVVKGKGRAVFPLNLSMLCPVFFRLELLQTREYDNHSGNARSFRTRW